MIRLHLACHPPKTTAQMKRVAVINGRPRFFHSARQQREAHTWAVLLRPHRPRVPMAGPVALSLVLVYPHLRSTPKRDRERWRPKVSKPDCDNVAKHLIDTLVHMRFIADDQQIAVLQVSKWHGPEDQVGIRLEIQPIAADTGVPIVLPDGPNGLPAGEKER